MRHPLAPLAPIAAAVVLLVACAACAHGAEAAPAAQNAATRKAAAAEAAELEAARQHPIARPEPRSGYPEQTPPARPARGLPEKAPPPREERGLPEQAPAPLENGSSSSSGADDRRGAGSGESPVGELGPAQTRVIAPEQPPLQPFAESRSAAPAVGYVWAPGYWYWHGGRYVWINGDWVAPRPGHVYVSARWVYEGDGWVFAPGGWAIGFGSPVVHPVYPHYWYSHRYGYPHHHHHARDWGPGHRASPRRWAPSDRSVVRPNRHHSAPRYDGSRQRSTTVVRPRSSSSNVNVGDVPRSSGERTRVKARRR